MKEEKGSSIFKSAKLIFGCIVFIFIAYAVVLFCVDTATIGLKKWSDKGTFGDSWGMLTALFSALAFGGLLVTIFQQQTDLDLTKQEIKDTRTEMKDQQFENTFFKMLEIYNSILADLDYAPATTKKHLTTGRDCIRVLYDELLKKYKTPQSVLYPQEQDQLPDIYKQFWLEYRKDLGHYYRFMYNTINYIDCSDQSEERKHKYTKIFQSQLSDHELALLFYNGASEYGLKFKVLIEKYHLLSNLPLDPPLGLLFYKHHRELYTEGAYSRN